MKIKISIQFSTNSIHRKRVQSGYQFSGTNYCDNFNANKHYYNVHRQQVVLWCTLYIKVQSQMDKTIGIYRLMVVEIFYYIQRLCFSYICSKYIYIFFNSQSLQIIMYFTKNSKQFSLKKSRHTVKFKVELLLITTDIFMYKHLLQK